MNKADLAQHVAEKVSLPKSKVEEILNTLLDTITEQLKKGEEVVLTGFGAFTAKMRAARQGVNPQNPSQKIQIKAVTVPKFKAGKGLKDALK
ncbi:MAG TPA: HU family DNA-binding protein [Candidatus Udaeobacter sp.]|nr:HU family DNA-binding protein [Candidatus Udaeobacter sp.]